MFKILESYRRAADTDIFPLKIRYAVCFPDFGHLAGMLPGNLTEASIWLSVNLEQLEGSVTAVFGPGARRAEGAAVDLLLKKVLAPSSQG